MTRTIFTRIWLFGFILLLSTSFYIYRNAEDYQSRIGRAQSKREQLTRDLRAGNQLSAALVDLDNFTIDEKDITRLDVLRHLDLEESELKFSPKRRSERKIGGTILFSRAFELRGDMTYAESLDQIDKMHNMKKVVLDRIELSGGKGFGDSINLSLLGTLYGLEKK